jgi:pimeloyl-ACP methyl ester carboxylesterase
VITVPKVGVDDIQIYYEVKGEGFPLVMIQGLSYSLDGWDPRLIEGLSKMFKLVLFDNRGAGRTGVSDREYSMKLFADDTAGLMDALGISKAHILGVSMGGMVAQELVLNYPERVAKLVLCSTGSQWCFSQEASRILDAMTELSQEELTKMILSLKFASDFVKEHPDLVDLLILRAAKHPISKEGWIRQLDAIRGFNTQGRLHKIRVPTLVLHGRKDVEIPPENGSVLAKAIPNAKLVYLEKSAHCLAEEMREVINVLSEFLD